MSARGLAMDCPMFHAVILGGIGLVLSTAGAIAMRGMGPMWYPLALIASNFPCTWIGGRLAEIDIAKLEAAHGGPFGKAADA